MIEIMSATSEEHFEAIRRLFLEYADSLGFDLEFQDFSHELAVLEEEYEPPQGCILLAKDSGNIVGCVALRPFKATICEMKRLYVKPKYRGKKIGKALVRKLISEACEIGYKFMRLDNHPWMKEAELLYKSVGFKEIEAYRFNPIEGAKFFELDLEKYGVN